MHGEPMFKPSYHYQCVKCGENREFNIEFHFKPNDNDKAIADRFGMNLKDEEHLEITCSTCGYFWSERCKDHKEKKDANG